MVGDPSQARNIAAELTAGGITTPRGGQWHPRTVTRLLGRIAT